ncbi:DUF2059 domain-containing protein [Xanthomonas albilineans]|uniref:DUF2059 domain-containing protein n=1 Tax=Xanthomonas albilineans (strain GPE PC73 / CFBP 7063) TaxID=380358 RepID=D2UGN0_XANAP|nr:DUF2059 domain-containing protein [Xanthomonas albilineans]PPU91835.1 DUF2059 domain-containing protein [Xanthomonas albilineans]QHQ29799.1 hypothetical protein XaFJ1_GM003090 [Xanthomonas albilineans]CBA17541.1 hypothetical protein XALC_3064 [Xanthomonas albilineans GPE PC73]
MNSLPRFSHRWPQRLLLSMLLALASVPALAEAPSDADINRLLSASRAQNMLDTMLPQIEAMQRQQFAQLNAQRHFSPAQQQKLQQIQERTQATVHQAMSWQEMRPLYVNLYKQSFSKQDVLAMAEFYESPAGQSMLDKTPQLMQNLMVAMQQKMAPLLANLQKELEQTVNAPPAKP